MKYILLTLATCLIMAGVASAEEPEPAVIDGGEAVPGPDATFKTGADNISLILRGGDLILGNQKTRLMLRETDAGYRTEFYAPDAAGAWQMVVRSARPGEAIPTAWAYGGCPAPLAYPTAEIARNDAQGVVIRLKANLDRHSIVTSISLGADSSFFHYAVEDTITGRVPLEHLISSLAFVPDTEDRPEDEAPGQKANKPDFVWLPRLRGGPQDVIGDTAFGSPAAILQKRTFLAALVPDVPLLAANHTMQAALNVDCSGDTPWMSYGFMKYETRDAAFHYHTGAMHEDLTDAALRYGFYLITDAQAPPRAGYRKIVDFLWQECIRPSPPDQVRLQRQPVDAWRESIWPGAAKHLLQRPEIRFTAAHQALRGAFGLARYARRTGDANMDAAARKVLDLALSAPVDQGAFPVIYRREAEEGRDEWVPAADGPENTFSTADCSNTARWLLRWREALAGDDQRILSRCKAYGDLLLKVQLANGCIPARLNADDLAPVRGPFYEVGAESAESAAFLAQLYAATRDERYVKAAMAALKFIESKVLSTGQWTGRDVSVSLLEPFNGQYAQGTAGMIAGVQACAAIYGQTGEKEYLALGERIADYLSLFQNVCECKWGAAPFGAVASRNFGDRFAAALQGEAAAALFELSHLTAQTKYIDRGVAALRSAFAMIDTEQAGSDPAAADVLAAADALHDFYGDVMINVAAGWGRGIGDCFISKIALDERSISFDLVSPFALDRPVLVRFWQCPTAREVIVNGTSLGIFTPAELWEGLPCPSRRPLAMEFEPMARSLAGVETELTVRICGGATDADVRLFCRRQGTDDFVDVAMDPNEDATYSAQIPPKLAARPGIIDYYIRAERGCENVTAPAGAPAAGTFTLSVLSDLTVTCGVEDEPYLDMRVSPHGQASEKGRVVDPLSRCVYSFPVPAAARTVELEIIREGICDVYIGKKLLAPVDREGSSRVYNLDDPTLWQGQRLRFEIQVPNGTAALLRSIKLVPQMPKED